MPEEASTASRTDIAQARRWLKLSINPGSIPNAPVCESSFGEGSRGRDAELAAVGIVGVGSTGID